MAGHSKWANIKHRKNAQDAKKGKIFTKLIKEIQVSVREGGPDEDSNPRLRLAIQNAKGVNMPKENIERAIKKATGEDGSEYYETVYEGYGPHGVAIFVQCTTDNMNRSLSNVRNIFTKHGGSLGTKGSLEFIFDVKGVFRVRLPEEAGEEELTLELIDGGAEDVEFDENYMIITTAMEDFGNMQNKLDELNLNVENAELERVPKSTVSLDNNQFAQLMKMIDALEDDDDVQKVYHNIEASDEQLATL